MRTEDGTDTSSGDAPEGQTRALIGCGIWENEYVKENGIWKFKKLFWSEIISSRWKKAG